MPISLCVRREITPFIGAADLSRDSFLVNLRVLVPSPKGISIEMAIQGKSPRSPEDPKNHEGLVLI